MNYGKIYLISRVVLLQHLSGYAQVTIVEDRRMGMTKVNKKTFPIINFFISDISLLKI